jgi:hypothetical protein
MRTLKESILSDKYDGVEMPSMDFKHADRLWKTLNKYQYIVTKPTGAVRYSLITTNSDHGEMISELADVIADIVKDSPGGSCPTRISVKKELLQNRLHNDITIYVPDSHKGKYTSIEFLCLGKATGISMTSPMFPSRTSIGLCRHDLPGAAAKLIEYWIVKIQCKK